MQTCKRNPTAGEKEEEEEAAGGLGRRRERRGLQLGELSEGSLPAVQASSEQPDFGEVAPGSNESGEHSYRLC